MLLLSLAPETPDMVDVARFCKMVRAQPRHDIGVMAMPDREFTEAPKKVLELVMALAFRDEETVP